MGQPGSTPAPRHRWPRRILVGFGVAVFVSTAAGFLYENICEARDRRFNPMHGKLVSVGPTRMHIDCVGEGTPTVILDSGLGDSYISWRKVQPEIAKFVRVCSYDRAGLGYSDSVSQPRTSAVLAAELHSLLQAAGIAPPYILVGHSMAGYDVRLFASAYRSEVVGMVLVDASHPDQQKRFPRDEVALEASFLREMEFLTYTTPIGLPRLMGFCDSDPVVRAADCNYHSAREGLAEWKAFSTSAAQTAATGPLGDIPLTVLSHDPDKLLGDLPANTGRATNDAWEKMQEELVQLSSRGTQSIAKNSGHYIQIDRPELVISAVHTVVEQARQRPAATAQATH